MAHVDRGEGKVPAPPRPGCSPLSTTLYRHLLQDRCRDAAANNRPKLPALAELTFHWVRRE